MRGSVLTSLSPAALAQVRAQIGDPPKLPKYGNRRCIMDGIRFDSEAERDRYAALLIEQRAGLISDLKDHPRFDIEVNGMLICRYEADASYVRDGKLCAEDVKGVRTALFIVKQKLMRAVHGIDVIEVKA
jgi:hypothetical protein